MPAAGLPSFSIGHPTEADLDELHRMVSELAELERLAHLCVSTPEDLGHALFGLRPVAEALIGRLNDKSEVIAGFALFFHTYSTFLGRPSLWLEDVFVRPAYRGRGLGRQFLTELAVIARDRGCGRFEWAVLDWNRPAIGFYESLGASVLPDWRIARVTGDRLEALAVGATGADGSG